jgi:peptide/nickel transport system permease protein
MTNEPTLREPSPLESPLGRDAIDVTVVARPPGVFRQALRLGRTRIGVVIAGVLALVALLGRYVAPFGESQAVNDGLAFQRSAKGTVFGTDYFGQDVLSRFLYGGRSVLVQALLATMLGVGLGATLGMFAAYVRGRVDEVLMRSLDIVLSFPQLLLSLVVIAMFDPSPVVVVLTVGLTTVPRVARVVRGAALQVVERDFVSAADALGESRLRIVFSEILPNVTAALLVELSLRLTYAIGLIAGLGFLGFTPKLNAASWGLMIQENRSAMSLQPWGVVLPVAAIALLTVGTGLIADGLSRTIAGVDRGKAEL